MFEGLKDRASRIRGNLLSLENQPIGKAALTVVVFLDFFIIVSIFDGLAEHTRQLTTPDEYITPLCRDIVITRRWNQTRDLDQLANLVNAYQERPIRDRTGPAQHPVCQSYFNQFVAVRGDDALQRRLKRMAVMTQEIRDIRLKLDLVRDGPTGVAANEVVGSTDAVRTHRLELGTRLEAVVAERAALIEQLDEDERIGQLLSGLADIPEGQRELLAGEYRQLSFWFPVKRLGMEMVFLIPMIAVFYFWNATSIRHQRPLQVLISSHLLVVTFVPVILKLLELVYEIIPRRLLQQIIDVLESLGLVALWHYLFMAAGIAAAMFAVYVFQKKLFSREKEMARRITKGLCQNCGSRLGENSKACPICGFAQHVACEFCNEQTYVFGPYCRSCGRPRDLSFDGTD